MIDTRHLFDMTVAISSPLSSATPSGRRATVITEGGTIHEPGSVKFRVFQLL